MRIETLAIHAGPKADPTYGAVMTPIYQVSTFGFRGVKEPGPFDYSRSGNPTRKVLEDTLAALDAGTAGFAFGTGMAAEATVLALLSAGDHLIVHDDLYGGTYRLVTSITSRQGVDVEFVNLCDIDALTRAIGPNTRAIWLESVTNPLMNVVALDAVAAVARERGILTICDNTFLSPCFLRPLELGIDIVIHSTTKYLNGHSDVVGGAAVVKDASLAERIGFLQNALGTCQAPQDCFLVLRGIKTLPLRMDRHHQNALALAAWLERHPKVAAVLHPGLPSHPAHALAARQFAGFGGTFSFRVRGGDAEASRLLGAVKLFTLAESLGGVESLIEQPFGMTHASMPEAARLTCGITADLIRVSVGLEHIDDLIKDLDQALAAV
jgi:cystathionine beta-lyase/cystathionine gamma-synthase